MAISITRKFLYFRWLGPDLTLNLTNAPWLNNVLKLTGLTPPNGAGSNARSAYTGSFGGATPGGTLVKLVQNSEYELNSGVFNGWSLPTSIEVFNLLTPGATLTQLATPTGTQATAVSQNALNVVASSVANASSYRLYTSATQTGTYAQLGGVLTSPAYSHTGLSAAQTQWYYWVAVGDGTAYSDSAPSAPFSGTTQSAGNALAQPVMNQSVATTPDSATFSWIKTPGANAYNFKLNSGTTYPLGDVNNYVATGLNASSAVIGQVEAVDTTGVKSNSGFTAAVTGTTQPARTTNWITAPQYGMATVPGAIWDKLFNISTEIVNLSRSYAEDGSSAPYWEPTAIKFPGYGFDYERDYEYIIQGRADLVPVVDMIANLDFKLKKVDASTNWVPDHISYTGQAFYQSSGGTIGPPLDNQMYFISLVWNLFKKAGNASYYIANKTKIRNVMLLGVTTDSDGVLPYIADAALGQPGRQGWGFRDSEFCPGYDTMVMALAFQAYNQLAEMASAAGDSADVTLFLQRADTIKQYANTNLFDATYGLYRVCTIGSNQQYCIPGSGFAVYCGMATPQMAAQISNKLYATRANWYYQGQIRWVATDNEFEPGVRLFKNYIDQAGNVTTDPANAVGVNVYGGYQNGGYWGTGFNWVNQAIRAANPAFADQMYVDYAAHVDENGKLRCAEWRNPDGRENVGDYCASATMPLAWAKRDNSPVTPLPASAAVYSAVYALRQKSFSGVAYTGPCLRLYRTSDLRVLDIGFTSNGDYDLSAHNAAVSAGYTKIRTWYDQSGNKNNATEGNPDKMPSAALDSINGKPAVRAVDIMALHFTVPSRGAAPRSLFIAYKNNSTGTFVSNVGGQYGPPSGRQYFVLQSRTQGPTGHPYGAQFSADLTDNTVPDLNPLLAGLLYDGSTSHLRRNGVEINTLAVVLESTVSAVVGNFSGGQPNSDCTVGEVVCLPTYATSGQQTQIENESRTYFGI